MKTGSLDAGYAYKDCWKLQGTAVSDEKPEQSNFLNSSGRRRHRVPSGGVESSERIRDGERSVESHI